jgi:tetratricopeptide (TPR) repeat protein
VNISGVLVSNRLWAHDAAAAITEAQRVLALHPDNGFLRLALAQALQQQGRFAEALSEIERAKTDEVIGRAALGHGYVLAGRRADAERMREALLEVPKGHRQPDYQVAAIDAALGNTNEAFARLESALAGRSPWMSWLKVEPMFDPIRPDPRFAALLARIGFK